MPTENVLYYPRTISKLKNVSSRSKTEKFGKNVFFNFQTKTFYDLYESFSSFLRFSKKTKKSAVKIYSVYDNPHFIKVLETKFVNLIYGISLFSFFSLNIVFFFLTWLKICKKKKNPRTKVVQKFVYFEFLHAQ